jgi:hypothetical protein
MSPGLRRLTKERYQSLAGSGVITAAVTALAPEPLLDADAVGVDQPNCVSGSLPAWRLRRRTADLDFKRWRLDRRCLFH